LGNITADYVRKVSNLNACLKVLPSKSHELCTLKFGTLLNHPTYHTTFNCTNKLSPCSRVPIAKLIFH